MLTKIRSFQFRRAVSISLGLALLWVVVALLRSGTTFHLAPILVAAAVPIAVAYDTRDLTLADEMTGPSLLPSGGAVTEAVVFSLTGAIGGFVIATLRR